MVESPCIKVCKLSYGSYFSVGGLLVCIGCGRTQDEIRDWMIYTDEEKKETLEKIKLRKT